MVLDPSNTPDEEDVNCILFLGAGASEPLGLPTTDGFLDKLKERLGNPESEMIEAIEEADGVNTLDDIMRELLDVVPVRGTGVGIEALLTDPWKHSGPKSYATRGGARSSDTKFERMKREVRKAQERASGILQTLVNLLYDLYAWNEKLDENDAVLAPYLNLLTILNNGHMPVFTTNYDLHLESYRQNGYTINDLFGNAAGSPVPVWQGANLWDYGPKCINLFKLHGSVHWELRGSKLAAPSPERINISAPSGYEDLIVLPGTPAGLQRNQEPFLTYYDYFDDYLSKTDIVISIGHRFDDNEITATLERYDPRTFLLNRTVSDAADNLESLTNVHPIPAADVGNKDTFARLREELIEAGIDVQGTVDEDRTPASD